MILRPSWIPTHFKDADEVGRLRILAQFQKGIELTGRLKTLEGKIHMIEKLHKLALFIDGKLTVDEIQEVFR